MDKVYNKVYSDVLNNFMNQFGSIVFVDNYFHPVMSPEFIFDIVQEKIFHIGDEIKLREDAVFFLVLNMHQMVVLPYFSRIAIESDREYDLKRRIMDGEVFLKNTISADVETIVRYAISISKKNVVTGGTLLKAVAKVYDRLGSAAENIWG